MREKSRAYILILLITFILFNSACGQSAGTVYVNEEKQAEKVTVLLNNDKYLLPLRNLSDAKIASIHFGYVYTAGFDSLLNKYAKIQSVSGNAYLGAKNLNDLSQELKFYNILIVQLNDADLNNQQIINFIQSNQKIKNVIVAFNGLSTGLAKLDGVTAPILWSSQLSVVSTYHSAQAIFGGVAVTQKLIDNYSPKYKVNMGFVTEKTRLQYSVPEDVGINANNLLIIDEIAREAINARATPGMVVLVAKDGKVIFLSLIHI